MGNRPLSLLLIPMPGPTKIPPALHDEIWRRFNDAETCAQIVEWLREEHGVEVGERAVAKRLEKIRKEHEEIVRAVKVEALTSSLQDDLTKLDEAHERAKNIEELALKAKKYQVALRAIDVQSRLISQRNRLAGGSNADTAQTLADLLALAQEV